VLIYSSFNKNRTELLSALVSARISNIDTCRIFRMRIVETCETYFMPNTFFRKFWGFRDVYWEIVKLCVHFLTCVFSNEHFCAERTRRFPSLLFWGEIERIFFWCEKQMVLIEFTLHRDHMYFILLNYKLLILWHVWWKPQLWSQQRQLLLRNGSVITPVARQWLSSRHVVAATDKHATIEELLEAIERESARRHSVENCRSW
jgi:hypothetical protein